MSVPLLKFNVYKVTLIQPEVCKGCWSRPVKVEVTISASYPHTHRMCQPCANRIITEGSERINRNLATELNRR